jgi:predicted lipoprotein with Yx(FWY)xxD motif
VHPENSRRRTARRLIPCAALAIAATLAAGALASGGALKLGTSSNSALGKTIVINPAGRTLYSLSTETTHHLLCTSTACLNLWPPLTVTSRSTSLTKAGGVQGKLGLLKRANGSLQVTLGGKPVYRYRPDTARGKVGGEGLRLAGGVWHAIRAAAPATPPAMTPTTGAPPTAPPYGY